ncbi:MAG: right-handed parallel beta-helix repeat-containing protein [Candidatus Caldarchaeum sp.]
MAKVSLTIVLILSLLSLGLTLPMNRAKALYADLRLESKPSQSAPWVVRVPGDTSTIQAAVNIVAEGGIILIEAGEYYEKLEITKSVHLIGTNRGNVNIFAHADSVISVGPGKDSNPIQLSLENLTIGRPNQQQMSSSTGITIGGTAQIMLSRVTINKQSTGILLQSDAQLMLSNVELVHNRLGLLIIGGHVATDQSVIKENQIGILRLDAPGSLTITHNNFLSNYSAAVIVVQALNTPSYPFSDVLAYIVDNQFIGNGTGVYLGANKASGSTLISRNMFFRNTTYGVAILQEGCVPEDPFVEVFIVSQPQALNIAGERNLFKDNGKGDLCPPDYPWPPGFSK